MNTKLDDILGQSIHSLLKPLGFKKKGLQWNRDRGEFVDVLTIQEAKHSTHEKRVFTLNLGVLAKSFYEVVWQKPLGAFANEADCAVRVRLGDLIQDKPFGDANDQWWELEDDVLSVESTTKQIVDAMISKGLSFLEHFDSFSAVADHLKKVKGWQAKNPLTLIYRALAEWRTEASNEALQTLTSIKGQAWETKAALVRKIIKNEATNGNA